MISVKKRQVIGKYIARGIFGAVLENWIETSCLKYIFSLLMCFI